MRPGADIPPRPGGRRKRWAGFVLAALTLALPTACRTVREFPPADLTAPGWEVRRGQAVWHPPGSTPELAGDLLLASHPDGRVEVQFTKTPLPVVIARVTRKAWEIHFPTRHRTYAAPGRPTTRLIWFQLAPALRGEPLPPAWRWTAPAAGTWRLENVRTGEFLEGYLDPAP